MAKRPGSVRAKSTTTRAAPVELVKDLHAIKVRVPADVRLWLIAASGALHRPQWKVIVDALLAYVGEAPALSTEKVNTVRQVRRTLQANGH